MTKPYIISHRGNLAGRIPERENTLDYIDEAIEAGFDVEIDLWFHEGKFFLGHDGPDTEVQLQHLIDRVFALWVHAKNLDVVTHLLQTELHWFWHDKDVMTLTSEGIPWAQPGQFVPGGITVEFSRKDIPEYALGVCTDNPIDYKNTIQHED